MNKLLNNPLLYCLIAGLLFGSWQVVARIANLTPNILFLITSVTATCVAIVVNIFDKSTVNHISTRAFAIIIIATLLNAFGSLVYARLITWKSEDISKISPIVSAISPIITFIVAFLLLNEPMTTRKFGGILLVTLGIYILSTS